MNRITQLPLTPLFFLLGILTRLPFATRYCRAGDMGNFVLAMDQINLPLGNPQMPGMFMVFLFLGRLFDQLLHNPVLSLTAVSILSSGIATAALYYLGSRCFSKTIGIIAGLLTLSSPMIWYQGSTGLSHMIEFAGVSVIMVAAYWTGLGDKRALYLLGLMMGLAGGLRPSTPFFMVPVALFATFKGLGTKKFNGWDFLGAFGVGLGAIALWFIPLIQSTGSWDNYWAIVQAWLPLHTNREDADSILKVLDNLLLVLKSLLRGVGLGLIPLLWLVGRRKSQLWQQLFKSWPLQVLLLALMPGLLFFVLVHARRKEQVMTIVPACVMLSSIAIVGLSDRFRSFHPQALRIATATIVSLNALFFLLGPSDLPTARNIREHNADSATRLSFIRETFDPATTAILTHPYSVRLGEVYFPDFQERWLGTRVTEESFPLADPVQTLVLLDEKVLRKEGQDYGFERHELAGGVVVRSRSWQPNQQLWVNKFATGIADKAPQN